MHAVALLLLLAVAVADPAPVDAPAPPAAAAPKRARAIDAGVFTFSVEPARIVLSETKTATVIVKAEKDSAPIDNAPPRLTASIGALSEPERIDAGVWRATYTPPANGPPQVAVLVAALDAGAYDAVGFTALSLWGKGETVVKTKAGSKVSVRAGSDTFGPIDADASGRARVPLALAPGIKSAITVSVDQAGNTSEKALDLGVPAFNRVALLAIDDVAVADATGVARLVAVVVDERGAPLVSGKQLRAKASIGEVELQDEASDGVARGMRILVARPGASEAGGVDVEISLEGARESIAKARIGLVTAAVAGARITLSRNLVKNDDVDRTVTATVVLVNAAGEMVPPQGAGVYVDFGRIAKLSKDDDGTRHVTWIIPAGTNKEKATLSVRTVTDDPLGEANVRLARGDLVDITGEPEMPRPLVLVGAGLLVGTNYTNVISAGVEASVLGRAAFLEDVPLYGGASLALHQSLFSTTGADHRAIPFLLEGQWRPSLAWGGGLQLVLGGGAGVLLSDLVRTPSAPHVLEVALAAQAQLGVGFVLGPGALDVFLRGGTALYLGTTGADSAIGLPLGASLVVAYRFAPL